jgi:hypothetical protein
MVRVSALDSYDLIRLTSGWRRRHKSGHPDRGPATPERDGQLATNWWHLNPSEVAPHVKASGTTPLRRHPIATAVAAVLMLGAAVIGHGLYVVGPAPDHPLR